MRNQLSHTTADGILQAHLVDAAILSSDDWDAFMRDRRERLRQLVATVCGGNVQPFSDADVIVDEVEEEDVLV